MKPKALLQLATAALDDMKALDIVSMDVRKLTDVADYMLICSGTSNRHTQSIANNLIVKVKANGIQPVGVESDSSNEWTLVDLGDVIVHIMLPKTREFYSLEKLWSSSAKARKNQAE